MRIWLAPCVLMFAGCQCQPATAGASGGTTSPRGSGGATGTGNATSAGATSGTAGSSATATGGAGNGSTTGGGPSCPATFTALTLSPPSASLSLDGTSPAPLTFTVEGTTAQGQQPVAAQLFTWTATRGDDTNPGTVAAGVFSPYGGAGGTVTITATGCGASGSATVTLTLQETFQTDGGSPSAFGDGGVLGSTSAPVIVYPSAETRFPRNVYKILFQWKPNGQSQFRLTFAGAASTVTVFTDGQDPGCAGVANAACWQADSVTWDAIAGSNAGSTVQLTIDGTAGPGAKVYLGAAETLGFSELDVRGAIFYWAANRGGIERATVSDAKPQDYLVGNNPGPATEVDGYTIQCAACHAVSRDGQKLAASVQAQGPTNSHGAWVMQVTVAPPPLPIATNLPGAAGDGYSAFSPDTTKLVWGPRNGGQLTLIDTATGATLESISVGGKAVNGSAVDWSPDGGLIAYADTQGGISTVAVNASNQFSNTTQIVAPAGGGPGPGPGGGPGPGPGGGAYDFPMFDPEGDQIAYANAADLFLVPAGGGQPVELTAASTIVNNAVATPKENNMPTWAPPGDLHWIAFNSQRPYGLLTNGGQNQIWVAGLDFRKFPSDPSFPAFWLPFQTLTDLNHRAFWTLDVRTQLPDGGLIGDGGIADAGSPDAGPFDAGTPVGGNDAGTIACVAAGDPCNPTTSTCCDPQALGYYCGFVIDGGDVCQTPNLR